MKNIEILLLVAMFIFTIIVFIYVKHIVSKDKKMMSEAFNYDSDDLIHEEKFKRWLRG